MREAVINIRYAGPRDLDPDQVARVCAGALVNTRPLEIEVQDAICRLGTPVMGAIGSYPPKEA